MEKSYVTIIFTLTLTLTLNLTITHPITHTLNLTIIITLNLTITHTITLTITITPHTQLETKGNEQNVWDEMKGDEVTLGQNDRGRNERDKMSVGRNEWDEM
jgi:hypothetical protein